MAYVLGFFIADGNLIVTKRGTCFLAFHSADKILIEQIKKAMESEHMVSTRSSDVGLWYRLQIGSKEMFEDLEKLGIKPNKAKRIKLPFIPESLVGDFIRGYFDGDGNVWVGKVHRELKNPSLALRTAFTSASVEFLNDLKDILHKNGIKGGSVSKVKNKECSRLSFATGNSLKLYEIMYNVPQGLGLKRKKVVFERFKQLAAVAQR